MEHNKRGYLFKKIISIVLTVIFTFSLLGNQSAIVAKAEDPGPQMMFYFDDRGNPDATYVSVQRGTESATKVSAFIPMQFTPDSTYTVTLVAPEERKVLNTIVEVRLHIEEHDDTILSNVQFFDGVSETDPNLTLNIQEDSASFNFDVPNQNCCGIEVNIWWSEYDRCSSVCQWDENGDIVGIDEYCLEVINDGPGEAYLDGVDDYPNVWEYTGYDNSGTEIAHWGGQKILIDKALFNEYGVGPVLKFHPYDDSHFEEYTIHISENNDIKKTASDFTEEPSLQLKKSDFNSNGYLNMDVKYSGQEPSFCVHFSDGKVEISGEGYDAKTEITDVVSPFSYDKEYTFTLTPPENRLEGCTPVVEVRIHNDGGHDTIYSNVPFHDDATDMDTNPNLTLSADRSFTISVPAEDSFYGIDVSIYWSEYDRVCPWYEEDNDGNVSIHEYVVEVVNIGNGDASPIEPDSENPIWGWDWEYRGVDSEGHDYFYGNQKFRIAAENLNEYGRKIQFNPGENSNLKEIHLIGNGNSKVFQASELGDDMSITIKPQDFERYGYLTIEAYFEENNNPGSGGDPDPIEPGHDGEAFKKLIESKQYAFGDWDNDNDVDADDLKLGMAQMIYYPEFNSNAGNSFKQQHKYPEVTSVDYLKNLISLTESAFDNLTVAYRDGTLTLPAYKYTVTFTDPMDESRSFTAEGIGYLFKFDGLSDDYRAYKDYSNENVIMYATQGSTTEYFLRNTHGEENNPSKDCQDPVTGNASGEGAFCAVADYDCGSQYNEYGRNIGIFGNGASLDNFIMSDPSESEFITLQGRNEDFARDTGHNGGIIFGKFSFYKREFTGMKIQGTGQNGNTPAWSFATDPIWGSDTDINTVSEAVVYFGNSYVNFYPVTINNFVTKITGFEKVDSRIPDGAVSAGITDNGAWVNFKSNFYDMVEFKVTYETVSGGSETEYIWLHRVGIDINEGHFNAGESILHHGTENGPKITLNQSYESLVYATYYYPEPNGTDEYVDLYATYTWKDGSVTKKLIANDSSLNLAFHHKDTLDNNQGTDDLQSSDFILYKGSKEGAPVKVEVSAVKSGSTDTEFKGMMFGSGRGVCYTLGK